MNPESRVMSDGVVELFVDRIVQGGDGLAELDGLKVFVRLSAPQERVRARIITRKSDYAVAEIEEVLDPSPLRANPPCPHYGVCGGCHLQHLSYPGQLVVKKLLVNETLQRVGRVFVPVRNITACPPDSDVLTSDFALRASAAVPWHYRNKTQYPVGFDGTVSIGFFRRNSHAVVDIPRCLLHPEDFDRLREVACQALRVTGETPYNEASHEGNVRHLIFRRATPDGSELVLVATRTEDLSREFVRELAEQPNVVGVLQTVNTGRTNRILGPTHRLLTGRGHLNQTVLGRIFRVSASSFFQVNVAQAEELCRKVHKDVCPQGTETVVDLYCGVGMLALEIAPWVQRVVGIELDPTAVEDARANALAQGARNVEFLCADADRAIDSVTEADVVILDPPRRGCSPDTLRRVAALRPHRIVYVSCNPATLARDLGLLEQTGYVCHEVEPVDMFPQTSHVEMVARLGRGT